MFCMQSEHVLCAISGALIVWPVIVELLDCLLQHALDSQQVYWILQNRPWRLKK